MIKNLAVLTLLIFVGVGCFKTPPTEIDEDPLNLFNDGPPVTVEGGTENDPFNLFTDEEERAREKNKNE